MNIEEIKSYIESNKDNEEVKGLIQGLQTPINLDSVKSYLEKEADGIAFLQSYTDKKVTQGITSYKANNMQRLIEEEIAKRNPQKTPEQIKMEELQRKIEAMEHEAKVKDLKLKFTDTLASKNMLGFSEYLLVGDDEEKVKENIDKFESLLTPLVDKLVSEKLKASSKVPPKGDKNPSGQMTRAEFSKLNLYQQQKLKSENPSLYESIMRG